MLVRKFRVCDIQSCQENGFHTHAVIHESKTISQPTLNSYYINKLSAHSETLQSSQPGDRKT
jgi:hypothetical protein